MTEIFLSKELINITNETIIKIEVNYVLNDILDSIEVNILLFFLDFFLLFFLLFFYSFVNYYNYLDLSS